MLLSHGDMERSSINTKWCLVAAMVLFLALGLGACSKQQVIVPKVTPEPTQLRLVGKFIWFDLFTKDLQSAIRFYEALLGWSFEDAASGNQRVKTIMYEGTPIGNAIQIRHEKGKEKESRWLSFMSVADVDRTAKLVEQNGGSIYMPPKDLPDRGRVAVVQDPEGALFAILTASEGDPPDRRYFPNRWIESELWTRHVDGALRFYKLIAGYKQEVKEMGGGSTYLLLTNNLARAGIVKIPWEGVKPNWIPYIGVKDIEAIVKKAENIGGKVLVALDANRKDDVAIIADPSGAVFAVQQL